VFDYNASLEFYIILHNGTNQNEIERESLIDPRTIEFFVKKPLET